MKKPLLSKLSLIGLALVLIVGLARLGGDEDEVEDEDSVVEDTVVEDTVVEDTAVEDPVEKEPSAAVEEVEIYGYWSSEVDPTFIMDISRENGALIYDYAEGYILAHYNLVWDEETKSGQLVVAELELELDISLNGAVVTFEGLDGSSNEVIPLNSDYAQATIVSYDPNAGQAADTYVAPTDYTDDELYGYGGMYSVDPYSYGYSNYSSYNERGDGGYYGYYSSYNERGDGGYYGYYSSYNEHGYGGYYGYYSSYNERGY